MVLIVWGALFVFVCGLKSHIPLFDGHQLPFRRWERKWWSLSTNIFLNIVFSRVEYVKINVKRKSLVATSSGSDVLVHGANFVDPKRFSVLRVLISLWRLALVDP